MNIHERQVKGQERLLTKHMAVKIEVGDVVELRKQHPCGNHHFEVMRTGADFRIKCIKCEKQIWLARTELERRLKKLIPKETVEK
ncbi:DUF951 domain-containing protein [Alkaliphilus crotonatoxidans]